MTNSPIASMYEMYIATTRTNPQIIRDKTPPRALKKLEIIMNGTFAYELLFLRVSF